MSLADKIKLAEAELVSTKDQLTEATKTLEEDESSEETLALVEELSDKVEKQANSLAAFRRAEQALAQKSTPLDMPRGNAPGVIKRQSKSSDPADLIVKMALIELESSMRHVSKQQVMEERYSGNDEVKAVSDFLTTKVAQNPAMTTVPAWAGELVQESMGAFMDLLKPMAVLPALNLRRYSFDGFGSIKVPMRNGAVSTPNLAGAFRAEGAPIRVGAAALTSKTLTPKSMGVIGTFTDELMTRSTQNFESLLRDFILYDTAAVLDTAFVGAVAGSATVPAGITNGLIAANTAVSAGSSVANMQADLKGRLARMASLNLGASPAWIMHPINKIAFAMALTATGQAAFPSVNSGTLFGAPIITSTNASQTEILLIDQSEIVFAGGTPNFNASSVATIHEEHDTPAQIGTAGTPNVVAAPVRSLWQTNAHGLRVVWEMDWSVMRAGAVQQVTGVAY